MLVAGGVFLPSPAGAAGDGDLIDRYTQVVYELENSAGPRVVNVEETVVDTTGRVLSRSSSRRLATSDHGAIVPLQAAPFACLNDREREGFRRHDPWELLDRGGNEFVHFQYFPYSQSNAQIREGQFTQQWLVCATGGVDAQNGSRVTVSGPVLAYKDEQGTYKIGQAWRDVGELRIWDPGAKAGKTLYRGRPGDGPLATTDWGPGGAVAAVRLPAEQTGSLPAGTAGRPPAVVVVRANGATSEIALSGDPGLTRREERETGWDARPDGIASHEVGGREEDVPAWVGFS
jgi:hypothetical protein